MEAVQFVMGKRHGQEFSQLMGSQYEQRMQKLQTGMESFLKEKALARQAILSDTDLAKDSAALLQALRDVEDNFAIRCACLLRIRLLSKVALPIDLRQLAYSLGRTKLNARLAKQ